MSTQGKGTSVSDSDSSTESVYDASSITVLEGLEAVRKRPGMYIGDTDDGSGLVRMVMELVDNSVGEALAGFAKLIEVILHADGRVTVRDDGRGIPVDIVRGTSAAEIIMTRLHAGGVFDKRDNRIDSGFFGVGCAPVNGLSASLTLQIRRGGCVWEQTYEAGRPACELTPGPPCSDTGTSITFLPDPTIFSDVGLDPVALLTSLKVQMALAPDLRLIFTDEIRGTREEIHYPRGPVDHLIELDEHLGLSPAHRATFYLVSDNCDSDAVLRAEMVLRWHKEIPPNLHATANRTHNEDGGTHVSGLIGGLTEVIRGFAHLKGLDADIEPEDVLEGLSASVVVWMTRPTYRQTITRLYSDEALAPCSDLVTSQLPARLSDHPELVDALVERAVANATRRQTIFAGLLATD